MNSGVAFAILHLCDKSFASTVGGSGIAWLPFAVRRRTNQLHVTQTPIRARSGLPRPCTDVQTNEQMRKCKVHPCNYRTSQARAACPAGKKQKPQSASSPFIEHDYLYMYLTRKVNTACCNETMINIAQNAWGRGYAIYTTYFSVWREVSDLSAGARAAAPLSPILLVSTLQQMQTDSPTPNNVYLQTT